MLNFLVQGSLCDLSIVLLVGLFYGINRFFTYRESVAVYEDLTRRGFIVRS